MSENFIQTPCRKVMSFDGHLHNTLLVCTALTHTQHWNHRWLSSAWQVTNTATLVDSSIFTCFYRIIPDCTNQGTHLRSLLLFVYFIITSIKFFKFMDCNNILLLQKYFCRSQWPLGLRRRSAVGRLLRLWIRIPPEAWTFVCCECCVCCRVEVSATSRSLVERSPTECGASLCVIQIPREWGSPGPIGGCRAKNKTKQQKKQKYFWFLIHMGRNKVDILCTVTRK